MATAEDFITHKSKVTMSLNLRDTKGLTEAFNRFLKYMDTRKLTIFETKAENKGDIVNFEFEVDI